MRRYLRHPQCLLLLALVCISLSSAQGQPDGNPGQGGGPPDGNPGQGGGQDDTTTTAATTTEGEGSSGVNLDVSSSTEQVTDSTSTQASQTASHQGGAITEAPGSQTSEDPTTSLMPGDPTTSMMPGDPTTSMMPEDPTTSMMPEDLTTGMMSEDLTTGMMSEDPKTSMMSEDPTTSMIPEDLTTGMTSVDQTTSMTSEDPTTSMTSESLTPMMTSQSPTSIVTSQSSDDPSTSEIATTPSVSTEMTVEVDPCDSGPCMNAATCSKMNGTTYTCTCAEGYTGQQCETDIDDCVIGSCENGGTCEDIGVGQVRCNCPPQWTGNTCSDDLDECAVGTDRCHEYANCTNQIGDHLCVCHAGYSGDGVNCTFDDPCAGDPCGSYGYCFATTFNFTCECNRGWEGVNCSQEIDGCARGLKLTCDAAWGQCVHTGPGQFECQCKKGSSGNGTHCFEEVLFDPITGNHTFYGPTATIAVDVVGGIPVLGKIFDRFYVMPYGYVSFGIPYSKPNAPSSPYQWPANQTIVAAYWGWGGGEASSGGTSGVFIKNYSLDSISMLEPAINDKLRNITKKVDIDIQSSAAPMTSLSIITWYQLHRMPASQYSGRENVTFQLILLTNGLGSVAIFNYGEGFTHRGRGMSYAMAISNGDDIVGNRFLTVGDIQRPDLSTNIETRGRYVIPLGNPMTNARLDCIRWQMTSAVALDGFTPVSIGCPCTLDQAKIDPFYSQLPEDGGCYETTDGSAQRTCCYHMDSGALEQGPPYGGHDSPKEVKIMDGRDLCCVKSDLCQYVYEKFPSANCSSYQPPSIGAIFGDPHIVTMDAKAIDPEFTFNGKNEYSLMKVNDNGFVIQGRFEAVEGGVNATRLTAVAAKSPQTYLFEARVNGNADINIHAQGVAITDPQNLMGITIKTPSTGTYLIHFHIDGVVLQLRAAHGYMMLRVYVSPMSPSEGLMGTINGDVTDDLTKRNGQRHTGTDEGSIFNYGNDWKLQNSGESLFTYSIDGSGASFTDYQFPDFRPTFIRDRIIANKNDLSQVGDWNVSQATAICQLNVACLVDLATTGHADVALITRMFQQTLITDMKILDNKPPVFTEGQAIVTVTLDDVMATVTFRVADDEDRNDVNVTVLTNIASSAYSLVSEDGLYTFTLNKPETFEASLRDTSYHIKFLAHDSMGASALHWPALHMSICPELNQTIWDTDRPDWTFNNDRFFMSRCTCAVVETDLFCSADVDPCASNPCFYNVTCEAANATAEVPYVCGECPPTLEGDGIICTELDECATGEADCDHICDNIPGSYECSCFPGYELDIDNKSCDDINECEEELDGCSGEGIFCNNTPGSFECRCGARYMAVGDACQLAPVRYYAQLKFALVRSTEGNIIWDNELTNPYSLIFNELAKIVESKMHDMMTQKFNGTFIGVKVVRFRQGSIIAECDLFFPANSSLNYTMIDEAMKQSLKDEGCVADGPDCKLGDLYGISIEDSFVQEKDLCASQLDNDCESSSTNCSSEAGMFSCSCRDGYLHYMEVTDLCIDVDECLDDDSCNNDTSTCLNLPGSYQCECRYGYSMQDGKCRDVCDPSPCENNGSCIPEESSYICECDGMWTGYNCSEEHEEAAKFRAIAIGVGVALGVICLILLAIAVFACLRRPKEKPYEQTRTYEEGYQNGGDITLDKWEARQRTNPEMQDPALSSTAFRGDTTGASQGMENPAYTESTNK